MRKLSLGAGPGCLTVTQDGGRARLECDVSGLAVPKHWCPAQDPGDCWTRVCPACGWCWVPQEPDIDTSRGDPGLGACREEAKEASFLQAGPGRPRLWRMNRSSAGRRVGRQSWRRSELSGVRSLPPSALESGAQKGGDFLDHGAWQARGSRSKAFRKAGHWSGAGQQRSLAQAGAAQEFLQVPQDIGAARDLWPREPGSGRGRQDQPSDLQNGHAGPLFTGDFKFQDSHNSVKAGPEDSSQPRVTYQGTIVLQEAPPGGGVEGGPLDKPPAAGPSPGTLHR